MMKNTNLKVNYKDNTYSDLILNYFMKCPHCLESFFESWTNLNLMQDAEGMWNLQMTQCPACEKMILKEQQRTIKNHNWTLTNEILIHPLGIARSPLPKEVLDKYSKPYKQAAQVLPISAEASAAISRRCLQDLLREEAKVKPGNLADEIQEVIDSKALPTSLSESIDAIRNIGNFGSHPIKSTNTGEVVDVEPGEAEWNLDVLEELFDHYMVKPAKIKAKRLALNQKLKDAGKSQMK